MRMRKLARKFKPTVIARIIRTPLIRQKSGTANIVRGTRSTLPSARIWASGIAFCGNPKPKSLWKPMQTLKATQGLARHRDTGSPMDVIEGYGR